MAALTFTALLYEDGTVEVEPGFVVDADPTPGDGPVEVLAFGKGRRPLASTRLSLVPACGAPVPGSDPPPTASFAAGLVEFPDRATSLVVTVEGKEVWKRERPGPLAVDVAWPGGLDRGRLELTWEGSSAECIGVLAYSSDDGSTWLPLSVPSSSTSIIADLSSVAGGKRCLLELCVTDGFSSQRLRSPSYRLQPGGWRVWILSPEDGAQLSAGAATGLAAHAFHLEERRDSPDVSWSSSLDGALGDGARLLASLSPGTHDLTATAMGGSTTIRVEAR